jgi:hypothetical protein
MGLLNKFFHKKESEHDEYNESEESKHLTNAIPFMPLNHPKTMNDASDKKKTS